MTHIFPYTQTKARVKPRRRFIPAHVGQPDVDKSRTAKNTEIIAIIKLLIRNWH
jgi:hypothetical protein